MNIYTSHWFHFNRQWFLCCGWLVHLKLVDWLCIGFIKYAWSGGPEKNPPKNYDLNDEVFTCSVTKPISLAVHHWSRKKKVNLYCHLAVNKITAVQHCSTESAARKAPDPQVMCNIGPLQAACIILLLARFQQHCQSCCSQVGVAVKLNSWLDLNLFLLNFFLMFMLKLAQGGYGTKWAFVTQLTVNVVTFVKI